MSFLLESSFRVKLQYFFPQKSKGSYDYLQATTVLSQYEKKPENSIDPKVKCHMLLSEQAVGERETGPDTGNAAEYDQTSGGA